MKIVQTTAANRLKLGFAAFLITAAALQAAGQTPVEGMAKGTPASDARTTSITVTKVDDAGLLELLKPSGKPLLVNFWATWCEPCREEFPDLVEIDKDYRGKIDFITVSLDDPVEINRDVTKFLREMGSTMPAYLLRTDDETAVIGAISDQWQGGLPFTVLYGADGKLLYARQGKIKAPVIRGLLDPLVSPPDPVTVTEFVRTVNGRRPEAEFYYRNNWMVIREEAIRKGIVSSYEIIMSEPISDSMFDFLLITRYEDKKQFERSESELKRITRELRPEGSLYLNDLRPDDFRSSVTVLAGSSISSDR